jgi:hypothetical protein
MAVRRRRSTGCERAAGASGTLHTVERHFPRTAEATRSWPQRTHSPLRFSLPLVLAPISTRSRCATARVDHGWEVNEAGPSAVARAAHHRQQPVNECDPADTSAPCVEGSPESYPHAVRVRRPPRVQSAARGSGHCSGLPTAPTTMKYIASPRAAQSCLPRCAAVSRNPRLHLCVGAGTSRSFLYRPLNTPPSATGRLFGQRR